MPKEHDMPKSSPRISVVSLWAEDVNATIHFYRDVIGLELLPHHGNPSAFDLEGQYLVIVKGKPSPAQDADPPHFPLLALAVDDLDQAVKQLSAHHVELAGEMQEVHGLRWVKFYDPAGNLIELVQSDRPLHKS
jgi:catechol 2,3-dioxygenase-like lactoylglutathione lyase family enzyme